MYNWSYIWIDCKITWTGILTLPVQTAIRPPISQYKYSQDGTVTAKQLSQRDCDKFNMPYIFESGSHSLPKDVSSNGTSLNNFSNYTNDNEGLIIPNKEKPV